MTLQETSLSQELKVRQANTALGAQFAQPAFELFADLPRLLIQLYGRLSSYGLRPSDMKFEKASDNLGEAHLRCYLFGFQTTLRIFLDRIELSSSLPDEQAIGHDAVIVEATQAVLAHLPGLSCRSYTSTLALHGLLTDTSPGDFLARFISSPPRALGPLLGPGVVFYYGAVADRLVSSVTLDLSAVVENGLFLKTHVVFDAGQVATEGLLEASQDYFRQTVAELGLVLRW